jgi:hypothetical protein
MAGLSGGAGAPCGTRAGKALFFPALHPFTFLTRLGHGSAGRVIDRRLAVERLNNDARKEFVRFLCHCQYDAFDLTPAMLVLFQRELDSRGVRQVRFKRSERFRTRQATALVLEQLRSDYLNVDA